MPLLQSDPLLDRLNEALRRRLGAHLKTIVLFGSRARGDYTPDSDYDLLIVVDEVTPSVLACLDQIAGDFLFEESLVFSLIPISEVSYQTGNHHPFLMNVAAEGVELDVR